MSNNKNLQFIVCTNCTAAGATQQHKLLKPDCDTTFFSNEDRQMSELQP